MKRTSTIRTSQADRIKRISWGAIFAGGLTALSVSILLHLLGVGIGFSTIDPLEQGSTMSGLGTGALIWWIIANLIALFLGGLVAGRMAGFPSKKDGGLHGFLAWGFYATVSFYFLATSVSSVVSGITGTIGSIFSGDDQRKVIVDVQKAQQESEKTANFSYENVKSQVLDIINRGEQLNVLPEDASEETKDALQEGKTNANDIFNDLNLDRKVDEFFNDLSFDVNDGKLDINVEENQDYIKKDELKQYIAQNTDLSQQEIDNMINEWEQQIDAAVAEAEKIADKAQQKAVKFSDKAADVIAKASIYAFIIFLLGAIAAYFGGVRGSPSNTVIEEEYRDHDEDRDRNYTR